MITNRLQRLYRQLALMALGMLLAAPQLTAASPLSISQSPLFITIALPPNITVLLDDSGSLQWGYAPDSKGGNDPGAEYVVNAPADATTSFTGVTTTVLSTCIRTSHGSCTKYAYSCPSGYVLQGSSTGTTSTAPSGTTCQQQVTTYSCQAGDTSSGSGSSMTCTGYMGNSSVTDPDTAHFKAAAWNPLQYDPTITYYPGYDASGNPLSTSFTAAWVNPYDTALGSLDLSSAYETTVDYNPASTESTLMSNSSGNQVNSCNTVFSTSGSCTSRHNAQAAFYYLYTPTSASAVANGCGLHTYGTSKTAVPNLEDDACYTKVTVSTTSGPGGTDERQNFANWFSFYRTRNLTVNTSANRAFTGLNGNMRVAWADMHTCPDFSGTNCQGWNSGTYYDNRIGTFSGTHRTDFFNWLARYPANNGTPLRASFEVVGNYYTTSGIDSPYAFNPHVTDSPEYVCRPNYAIVMTDGLWNESDSALSSLPGNADNTAVTLPDGTQFTAGMHPFTDGSSNNMADIAFHYWSTNLRPDLGTSTSLQYMPFNKNVTVVDSTNKTATLIPYWNPANDPASWPHMVTFTVGVGLTSFLTSPQWTGNTYAGGYANVATGTTAWPATSSNSSNNAYDLWHAAIDGRGEFFPSDHPQDVALAFNSIVTRIQGRVGSSSAIAVNSTRLDSNTFIYQAQFNSANWTGEVLAFKINSDGSIGAQQWQASTLIPAASSRNILTWDGTLNSGAGGGTSFLWSSINTNEQTALNNNINQVPDGNGSLRLNYLRGDQSDEQTQPGGIFRIRTSLLGDIVNSNPQYVGNQDFGFANLPGGEGSSYPTFVATKASRTPMLYVGSNDGMMHAINANTGAEVFDYVPRGIYNNLSALTDPLYVHQFYVDGSPVSVDAYISGGWKSLLAGTTGAGGRDVFLMDVTSPLSETASNIMWDYDGAIKGDNNLGYTIGAATIVRMHDGDWYVLFGNGYNSPNQQAVIYLYDITAKMLRTYSTNVGSASTPNGMSTPNPVDYNGDRITDAIYAGDLQGNIWKLDVSDSSPSNWKFTTYGTGVPTPLFTAKDGSGNVQPITDRPQVGLNANGQVEVYFGTGTYFQTGDNTVGSNPPVQSFYGIVDDKGNTSADQVPRSNLLQQTVVTQTTLNGTNFRITTDNPPVAGQQGWYIDLNYPTAQGERVVSDAVLDNGRVVFTTLIPQGNACQFGGISWLMELDGTTGGALTVSPFDTNGDGQVNNNDYVTVSYTDSHGNNVTETVPVSGKQSNVGIIKTPGIISAGKLQYKYYSGSTGSIGMTVESGSPGGGRLSWQQLQ